MTPEFWARPFAHRGLHDAKAGRPENSIAAIRAAVDAGYGVEFDIQRSADGEAMVFHDYTLQRLTGRSGRVDALDAEALETIRLSKSDETVPTLAQVLDLIGGRAPALLEIKDQSGGFRESDGILEARVAEILQQAGTKNCAVISFNPFSVMRIRNALPDVPLGLVSYDFEHPDDAHVAPGYRRKLAELDHFEEAGADFVSYGVLSLPTPRVEALRAQGVPIFCWTVKSEQQAETALRHCDQITFEGYLPS